MIPPPDALQNARARITQVFRYLEAFNQRRNPVKRQIREQSSLLWFRDLPQHPLVAVADITDAAQEPDTVNEPAPLSPSADFVLKIQRPGIKTFDEAPPSALAEWVIKGWDDPFTTVQVIPQRERIAAGEEQEEAATFIELFEDDPERVYLFGEWRQRRDAWAAAERPARQTRDLFGRVYDLYNQIQREAERVELVLGDGILNWRRPTGGIHHPVLLQHIDLVFDAEIPEFRFVESDRPVEFYSALLRVSDVPAEVVAQLRTAVENGPVHPLEGRATGAFLQRLANQLSAQGQFLGETEIRGEQDYPRVARDRVIFLRNRTQGFAAALEAILQDIEVREDFPPSLLGVVGAAPAAVDDLPSAQANPYATANEDNDILFSKPANPEQLRIAQRLVRHGAVLVQGPPGTGKTHTIGNLIGHLLAQGKSVLVTSHTTKALRVVRDQVVEELRPLCVSVLENDSDGRAQLESSVQAIADRLTASDVEQLEAEAQRKQVERGRLLERLRDARRRLHEARAGEFRDVVVAGQTFTPSNAARWVAEGVGRHDWIPALAVLGAPLPLAPEEVADLYQTNVDLTPGDEEELSKPLPSPGELVSPAEFDELVAELRRLEQEDQHTGEQLWQVASDRQDAAALADVLRQVAAAAQPLLTTEVWKLEALLDGYLGDDHRAPWDTLLAKIADVRQLAASAQLTLVHHAPLLSSRLELDEQTVALQEILEHLASGATLNWWARLTHPGWRALLPDVRVNGKAPRTSEEFGALLTLAKLQIARRDVVRLWERIITANGGPDAVELGDEPERVCEQYAPAVADAVAWRTAVWEPLERQLEHLGFRWQLFFSQTPPNSTRHGGLFRLRDTLHDRLPPVFSARSNLVELTRLNQAISELASTLAAFTQGPSPAQVVARLHTAALGRDEQAYRAAFDRLVELDRLRTALLRRQALLEQMEIAAPGWARAIRNRLPPHDGLAVPGDVATAWRWRQLNDELDERNQSSLETAQQEVEQLSKDAQRTTTELIDRSAWARQLRMSSHHRQDLVGWLQLVRRIGRGTGRRAPRLQLEARRLMTKGQAAVPVWIMPLARVAENFNPATTRFDVVIIDEASQSDSMALLALYLGRQVIVVGDDKQVTPDAVGQRLDDVERLIDEHLIGVPNALLYDGQQSIYDLAAQSFGGQIMLREHFRSVADIIQFSNYLSYEGKILPLREASGVRLKPHVVEYAVHGGASNHQVNEVEATELASLLVAATEQPEYATASFGVISLVGEEQARRIDLLLRNHLSPAEYDRRRIVSGNSAQFQGDERDVMFLSVVDGPVGGVLPLRASGANDMFKKRFNVAASRARNQMWVVHSLDPQTDLQAGDIRRRLIEHARNPGQSIAVLEATRSESEFERLVALRLRNAGYNVAQQWRVGHYRIDMVVQHHDQRLAIECDGDRFHTPDNLLEDMARQAILERLGWTFVRIRGTQFFRNPDAAMAPVFARLRQMGIGPEAVAPDTDADGEPRSELIERVIRRAAALRRQWAGDESGPPTEAAADGPPGSVPVVDTNPVAETSPPSNRHVPPLSDRTTNDAKDDGPIENQQLRRARLAVYLGVPVNGRILLPALRDAAARSLRLPANRLTKSLLNRAVNAEVNAGSLQTDWTEVWRTPKGVGQPQSGQ